MYQLKQIKAIKLKEVQINEVLLKLRLMPLNFNINEEWSSILNTLHKSTAVV